MTDRDGQCNGVRHLLLPTVLFTAAEFRDLELDETGREELDRLPVPGASC